MRFRKYPLGDKNLIGAKVIMVRQERRMKQKELLTKLQLAGLDINAPGLSKLEGQTRGVTDIELVAVSKALKVPVAVLLGCS